MWPLPAVPMVTTNLAPTSDWAPAVLQVSRTSRSFSPPAIVVPVPHGNNVAKSILQTITAYLTTYVYKYDADLAGERSGHDQARHVLLDKYLRSLWRALLPYRRSASAHAKAAIPALVRATAGQAPTFLASGWEHPRAPA